HEHSVELLQNSSVEIFTPFIPERLNGDGNTLQSVTFKQARGEEEIELEVDDFIVSYGISSSIGSIKDWGLELQRNAIITNTKMETNLPGIFAVGDIATYEGKVQIIATGFGEAPIAVNQAMAYIHPEKRIQTIHSSSLF
ncbi:MAG: NAD(P)/FAD-dependent oxidoreductase, partial [Granulicatella sp.]|nr:NAD(P)/FAD-dependent oxidoreductase [Granulicatella sp.]